MDRRRALRRAEHLVAELDPGRRYFLSGEVAQILDCHRCAPKTLADAGLFPAPTMVNGVLAFEIDEVLAFLRDSEYQLSPPRGVGRTVFPMLKAAPDVLPSGGVRTQMVLSALKDGPKNTAELIAIVGPNVRSYIYSLRRRHGADIRTDFVDITDKFGQPHARVARYTLLKGGGHD